MHQMSRAVSNNQSDQQSIRAQAMQQHEESKHAPGTKVNESSLPPSAPEVRPPSVGSWSSSQKELGTPSDPMSGGHQHQSVRGQWGLGQQQRNDGQNQADIQTAFAGGMGQGYGGNPQTSLMSQQQSQNLLRLEGGTSQQISQTQGHFPNRIPGKFSPPPRTYKKP